MKQNSAVPAFLTKLWTLVEDSDTNEFICWSQEGNSFLVLDEQRFAKEILPKFFKHNNMASFVRQLNMYGFRKVMHLDTGIIKQERDGPVEFQHPYFKHGQDDLLENIKRKVSSARPEENKIRPEDLSKILSSVQNFSRKQDSIDSRLATLKRENEALWREVSDLRQKHTNQQQLIKKLIHFIVTLVQNNRLLSLKRKRPLLLNGNGKKPKFIHQIYDEALEHNKAAVNSINQNGLKNNSDISDDVIICDITDEDTDAIDGLTRTTDQGDFEIVEVKIGTETVSSADNEEQNGLLGNEHQDAPKGPSDTLPTSSALQVNKPLPLSLEDPVKMMDSILNESGAISQNINLLGKVELMDYLDSIDCSFEDFQAMLYGKHFNIEHDVLEEAEHSKENDDLLNKGSKADADNADKQLIQYTTCPLMAFLDGCAPLASEAEGGAGDELLETPALAPDELLGEADQPPPARSSLIRLEPLTEAEASEATLFYLCELNPETPCGTPSPLEV